MTHEEQIRPVVTPSLVPAPVVAEPATRASQLVPGMSAGGIQALHAPTKATPGEARAALRYIESSAKTGLRELEASTPKTRDDIVAKIALEVSHASGALSETVTGIGQDHRAQLHASAHSAADAVHRVWSWIDSRSPNSEMLRTFGPIVGAFDSALQSIGVRTVARRDAPPLTGEEQREAGSEARLVTKAASQLKNSIAAEREQLLSGIGTFSQLAAIDDQEPPPFIEAIAKALISAAAGHIFGEAMGLMLQRLTKEAGRSLTTVAHDRFVNVQTDTFQGFASELMNARKQAAAAETAKARIYFAAALQNAAILDAKMRANAIDELVEAKNASPEAMNAEARAIGAGDLARGQRYTQTASHLWALYQSQLSLGVHAGIKDEQNRSVSRMNDYFGVRNPAGDREAGTSQVGTRGAARLAFNVTDGTAQLVPEGFEITGANRAIAAQVAALAGQQFDRLWLPKEVTVYLRHYRAVLAIDEQNRVRDSIGWDEIKRASPNEPLLQSPNTFWAAVRGSRVS